MNQPCKDLQRSIHDKRGERGDRLHMFPNKLQIVQGAEEHAQIALSNLRTGARKISKQIHSR